MEIHEIDNIVPEKKRGRKPKPKVKIMKLLPKKRKKPKGEKLLKKLLMLENNNYIQENVILHLKCNRTYLIIMKNNNFYNLKP